jgi:hypothetical protein
MSIFKSVPQRIAIRRIMSSLTLLVVELIAMLAFAPKANAQFSMLGQRGGSDTLTSNYFYFGLGILNHNASIASTDASLASRPYFEEVYTQATLSAVTQVSDEWSASLDFTYGFPQKTTPENKETTGTDALSIRAHWAALNSLDLHVGPGILYYEIKGQGGTQTENNGSSTATYGIPSDTRVSTLLFLDLGAGYQYDVYRLDASFLVSGITSSAQRAVSSILTFSMGVY